MMTRGAVFATGMLNLFFNNCDFINSPSCPGVADNEKLDKYMTKLDLKGIETLTFFNKIVHLKKSTNQLIDTKDIISGK